MTSFLIKNIQLVDSGRIFYADLLTKNDRIEKIAPLISTLKSDFIEINGEGKIMIPGAIDVHVHFREPGLTHKADIFSESRAAVAGGITSYIEMPNTKPKTTNIEALKAKFDLAQKNSIANYSFYMGATNTNWDELIKALEIASPGIKVFLGASTGNMLVDDQHMLERIFKDFPGIIMVHSEDEAIINANLAKAKKKFGAQIPFEMHADIRSADACYKATHEAINWAEKYNSRLHIAHLSTEDEIQLLNKSIDLKNKRITSEVCSHHLWFDKNDYSEHKGEIKCNPSIKEEKHKEALLKAALNGTIDLISSDHAPHTKEEKNNLYSSCPSGIPLVQHSLLMMLDFWKNDKISLESIVDKMCHNPAISYNIQERGFLKEGYKADLTIIDPEEPTLVGAENILYKCGWSPFEGYSFQNSIAQTFVNGHMAYSAGGIFEGTNGEKLQFE
ncbi:MAG: dihydroorotase [Bacteroidetes bacterium]|nr:dihydroorotase [Bacteroidota bacterium]